MAEAERPPRVVPLRGGRPEPPPSAGDMARRLGALERQVERALAGEPGREEDRGPLDAVRTLADDTLGVAAKLGRWLAGEPVAGLHPLAELSRQALYRVWWRVDLVGRERVPPTGRALIVVNRAGTLLPYEPFMVAAALGTGARQARPFVDEALLALPVVGRALVGFAAQPSRLTTVRRALELDELAVTQPEGPDGVAHPWSARYRVTPFGRGGALRAAIETGAPIIPIAAIGAEEAQPTLARLVFPGRLLGLPAVPLAATLLPLPTKWTLYVGDPLEVAGRFDTAAARDATALRALRVQLRERLQALVTDGLRRRRGIFG